MNNDIYTMPKDEGDIDLSNICIDKFINTNDYSDKLKVKIISHSPQPEKVIATAAKLCYSSSNINDLMEKQDKKNIQEFLNMLMSYGHESPIEHVSFTFAVEGVSRITEQQLTRHRIASYSIQSGRYVKREPKFSFPPIVVENEETLILAVNSMKQSKSNYLKMSQLLEKSYIEKGYSQKDAKKKAIEDARYFLLNSLQTKIMFTMNARTLMNFFKHRCCNRAQWEIRELAEKMLIEVKKVAPTLFKYAGPSCINSKCPEGIMTCGKSLEMKEKYCK